jgi:lipopolysaccharide/colanic/teichoic acid biosynthesis glycosyltransferase
VLHDYLREHPEAQAEWDDKHKLKNDPRVTRIGKFLRSTSLDELPQLWNVFTGEMSLVGPRPIINSPTYDAGYISDYPAEYEAYKSVRPGVTGLWQVRCRNRGVYEMRIYYDMYYIRNWGIWLDLYLILATFKTVLLREGH